MKHLVPGPRDVTLRVRGLGRLPRGNGEGARNGGAECKLPLPPPPSQEKACGPSHLSHGVPVPPCGTGPTGKLLACGGWEGRGGWSPTQDFGLLESTSVRERLRRTSDCPGPPNPVNINKEVSPSLLFSGGHQAICRPQVRRGLMLPFIVPAPILGVQLCS